MFEDDEIVVVEFGENLPIGEGILSIAFEGTLNDRMKGFYRRYIATLLPSLDLFVELGYLWK